MLDEKKNMVPVIFGILVVIHLSFLAIIKFTTIFENTFMECFGITVLILPYLAFCIGLPVLKNNGLGGSGWAFPNFFGWILSIVIWLVFYWFIAVGINKLLSRYE